MMLEAESERLYVGARGAVFALNASDISASSALTVSVFVPVLPHVVRLVSLSPPWLHLHSTTRELLRQKCFSLSQKFLFPPQPLCVSVANLFLTQ